MQALRALSGDSREVVASITVRMAEQADAGRFEQARGWRDRLEAYLRASVRAQRLRSLTEAAEIVAASASAA